MDKATQKSIRRQDKRQAKKATFQGKRIARNLFASNPREGRSSGT